MVLLGGRAVGEAYLGLKLMEKIDSTLEEVKALLEELKKLIQRQQAPPELQQPAPIEIRFPQVQEAQPQPWQLLAVYDKATLPNGGSVVVTLGYVSGYNALTLVVRARYSGTPSTGLTVYWMYGVGEGFFDSMDDTVDESRFFTLSTNNPAQRTKIIPFIAPVVKLLIVNNSGVDAQVEYWVYRVKT